MPLTFAAQCAAQMEKTDSSGLIFGKALWTCSETVLGMICQDLAVIGFFCQWLQCGGVERILDSDQEKPYDKSFQVYSGLGEKC